VGEKAGRPLASFPLLGSPSPYLWNALFVPHGHGGTTFFPFFSISNSPPPIHSIVHPLCRGKEVESHSSTNASLRHDTACVHVLPWRWTPSSATCITFSPRKGMPWLWVALLGCETPLRVPSNKAGPRANGALVVQARGYGGSQPFRAPRLGIILPGPRKHGRRVGLITALIWRCLLCCRVFLTTHATHNACMRRDHTPHACISINVCMQVPCFRRKVKRFHSSGLRDHYL
jgi:hypothetical protein